MAYTFVKLEPIDDDDDYNSTEQNPLKMVRPQQPVAEPAQPRGEAVVAEPRVLVRAKMEEGTIKGGSLTVDITAIMLRCDAAMMMFTFFWLSFILSIFMLALLFVRETFIMYSYVGLIIAIVLLVVCLFAAGVTWAIYQLSNQTNNNIVVLRSNRHTD